MKPRTLLLIVSLLVPASYVLARREALPASPAVQAGAQAPSFEVDPFWPKPMPNHWLLGSAAGIAIDSRDHVFVVNLTDNFVARTEIGADANPPIGECCRSAPAVLEFDPAGTIVNHWGGPGTGYTWPAQGQGLGVDPKGNVWIGGSGANDSQILKFGADGKFLSAFGQATAAPAPATPAAPAPATYDGVAPTGRGAAGATGASGAARGGGGGGGGGRGGPPKGSCGTDPNAKAASDNKDRFGGAAKITFDAAANEAYVADGCRNHRVVVLDTNTGAVKRMWGAYGTAPNDAAVTAYTAGPTPSKQFGAVRCVTLSTDGMVYVCDSTNDRIQVFKKDGTFVKETQIMAKTRGEGAVWDIAFSKDGPQKYMYVVDGANEKIHILDRQSLTELTSFGDGGRYPGQFLGVHSIAVDSKGNIFTAETYEGKRIQKFTFKGVKAVPAAKGGK